MRKNLALIASFIGLVGLSACAHTFNRDMTKSGWVLVEDVGAPVVTSGVNLELVSFLTGDETRVSGEEMARRAKNELGVNLGQRDAEYLLEHQDEIPEDWQSYFLVFSGTKWRDSCGGRRVSYLFWNGNQWYLGFGSLDGEWHSSLRLVRPSK